MPYIFFLEVPLPTLQAPAAYFDIVRLQDICDMSERSVRNLHHCRVVNYETKAGVIHVEVEMGLVGSLQDTLPFRVRRSLACECAIRCAYTKGGVLKIGRKARLSDVQSGVRFFQRHLPFKTSKKHNLIRRGH